MKQFLKMMKYQKLKKETPVVALIQSKKEKLT